MLSALSMRAAEVPRIRTTVRTNVRRAWVTGAIINPTASGVQNPANFCAPEAGARADLPCARCVSFFVGKMISVAGTAGQ